MFRCTRKSVSVVCVIRLCQNCGSGVWRVRRECNYGQIAKWGFGRHPCARGALKSGRAVGRVDDGLRSEHGQGASQLDGDGNGDRKGESRTRSWATTAA